MKPPDRNKGGSHTTPLFEKLRRRPNYNHDVNSHGRTTANYNMTLANEFGISSSNNSLISDHSKSVTREKKQPNPIEMSVRASFSKNFIKTTSNFELAISSNQKSDEYKPKITNLQERMAKLAGDELWGQQLQGQFHTYSTQTRLAMDKVYAKFAFVPEPEQDIMTTLFNKEMSFLKLIKTIRTTLFAAKSQNNILNQQVKALGDENKKLKTKYHEERRRESEEQEGKSTEIQALMQETIKKTEKNERIWAVEKQQMAAQIQKLSSEIELLRDTSSYADLKNQYESFQSLVYTKVKELEKEVDEKDVKIIKMENLVTRTTTSYKELQKEHKDLTKKYNDFLEEFSSQKGGYDKVVQARDRYREMALMSKEDLMQSKVRYEKLIENMGKLQQKFDDVQYKLDKLKREQNETAAVNEAEFERDSTLLNVVKEAFISSKRPPASLKLDNSSSTASSNDMNSILDNIHLEKYMFNKPTFYTFIQQELEGQTVKQQEQQSDEKSGLNMDRDSLAAIRAILDSKYNELIYYDDYKLHSSFPDFVYSWLATFYVCPNEKKIKLANADNVANIQARRVNLYKCVMNPKMNKIWDVATFRDFLEEKSSADEVFFYLSCRYMLFQGPQLSHFSACINPIQWVQFKKAENLIDFVMKKLGQEETSTLKYKLKERAKKKANKFFIDAGLVLRVLLEFYRNEKKIKVAMLRDTLSQVAASGKNMKPHVNFDIFKQFVEINYPFASELEKATLYREAWYIGNGKVDHESFFIAANESNFFTGSLKLMMFPKVPYLENYSNNREEEELREKMNDLVKNKYKDLLDLFDKSRGFARTLGIESVLSSITTVETHLTKKFNYSYDENKGQGLYVLFHQLMQTFIKVRNQYFLAYRNTAFNENQLAMDDINSLELLLKTIEKYTVLEQRDQREKNNKAKKLQLCLTKRKKGFFGLVNKMLSNVRSKVDV